MLVLFQGRLLQLLHRTVSVLSWREVMLLAILHCVSSWFLVGLFDPELEYTQPTTYWWFHIVTITTVGYGDFSPQSLGARIVVAGYVMVPGIALMGVVIGKIAAVVVDFSLNLRKGLVQVHQSNHVVVIGDTSPRTIDLLENLLADNTTGAVVLVSARDENPLNGRLAGFVSGEIDNPAVQQRACLEDARLVIVLADNDVTVTGRTIAVMDANSTARIIAYFQHRTAADNLDRQSPERVCTVVSIDMSAVVQEALDPGAARFAYRLLHNSHGETYLRLVVPDGVSTTFIAAALALMQQRVNPLGVYENGEVAMCPSPDSVVRAGTVLAVAALDRRTLNRIDWSSLQNAI